MPFRNFELEHYQSLYERTVDYNLADSTMECTGVRELLRETGPMAVSVALCPRFLALDLPLPARRLRSVGLGALPRPGAESGRLHPGDGVADASDGSMCAAFCSLGRVGRPRTSIIPE